MNTSPPHSDDIRIAVIDDHDVIHTGVGAWCAQATPPVDCRGAYTTAEAFLAEHPHHGPTGPDVVVVDLELRSREPDFDSLAAVVDTGIPAVVYSHIEAHEIILTCLDIGAVSYLVKNEGQTHFLDAIRAAARAEPYVGPHMGAAILGDSQAGRPQLSEQEREVLKAWFQTENKGLVARHLYLSEATVKTYLQRIRVKYAAVGRPANTKAALLARAIQDGLISVNDV